MDSWKKVEIGDICAGIFDGPHATPRKVTSGPIFLGISNLISGRLNLSATEHISENDFEIWTRRVTPRKDDIVFSYETRLGEAAILPGGLKCCLGRRMGLLRPDPRKVIPRFLLYAYLSPEFQQTLRSRTIHGSTVDRLPLIDFPRFPISVPRIAEQERIAGLLGGFDDKIELNGRMNDTLEAMARAIFKSWFVDFDPVRAKAEDRQPFGMGTETAALFPNSFEDSLIGKIPKGWHAHPLNEAFEINPSRSLTRGQLTTYLDMQNMPTKGHRPHGWIEREFVSGSRFTNGDTLVARITPCLENGKTAYVDFLKDGEVGWGSTEFIVFRPKSPLPPEYGYCVARDEEFRDFAIQNMTGSSGRQRVPTDCFGGYSIIVPTEPIAAAFQAAVRPLFAKVKANAIEISILVSIRDSLLPKLISGAIRVAPSHLANRVNK